MMTAQQLAEAWAMWFRLPFITINFLGHVVTREIELMVNNDTWGR